MFNVAKGTVCPKYVVFVLGNTTLREKLSKFHEAALECTGAFSLSKLVLCPIFRLFPILSVIYQISLLVSDMVFTAIMQGSSH